MHFWLHHLSRPQQEGIVFKRVFNFSDTDKKLLLVSDNRQYDPYPIKSEDVLEVWEVKAYFSTKFPDIESTHFSAEQLATSVLKLQEEVYRLKIKKK